jgi:DivIVA domain-containing protein
MTQRWLTPEQVHNIAFTVSVGGAPVYDQPGVDAFLDVVEQALNDPSRRLLTAEQVRNTTFAQPPIGWRGYDKAEVDSFLALLCEQLAAQQGTRMASTQSEEPARCLLQAMPSAGGAPKPALVLEVGSETIQVLDASRDTAIAAAALAEVTARPAQHGGLPVVVLEGAGIPTLSIRPRHAAGAWRRRPKTQKPDYHVTDAEFRALVQALGLGPHLGYHEEPQGVVEHIMAWADEWWGASPDITWRTLVLFGVLSLVLAAVIPTSLPITLIAGLVLLLLGAVAWRFGWRF